MEKSHEIFGQPVSTENALLYGGAFFFVQKSLE